MTQEQRLYIIQKLTLLNNIDKKLIEEDLDQEETLYSNIKRRESTIRDARDDLTDSIDVIKYYNETINEFNKYSKAHKNALKLVEA